MSTWPKRSDFAVQVPPDAIPASGEPGSDPPIEFSFRVPTRASYDAWDHLNGGRGLPLIVELEPSNITLHEHVVVHTTYMPWTEDQPSVGEWILWTGTPENSYPIQSIGEVNGKVHVTYSVPHFSRWETGGGGPPAK
jgi:hypothetical protein